MAVVGERLPHPHEDDVAEPSPPSTEARAGCQYHLLDDLSCGELPGETHLARCTKAASHGAARLTGDASGQAVPVAHQDGLDTGAVGGRLHPLDGGAAVALHLVDDSEGRREEGLAAQPAPQATRQLSQLTWLRQLAVKAVPQLVDPVGGLPCEQLGEL